MDCYVELKRTNTMDQTTPVTYYSWIDFASLRDLYE